MKATIAGRISAILIVFSLGVALALASCTKPESEYTDTAEKESAIWRTRTLTEPDVLFFATTPLYGEIFMRVGGHYFTHYPKEW